MGYRQYCHHWLKEKTSLYLSWSSTNPSSEPMVINRRENGTEISDGIDKSFKYILFKRMYLNDLSIPSEIPTHVTA